MIQYFVECNKTIKIQSSFCLYLKHGLHQTVENLPGRGGIGRGPRAGGGGLCTNPGPGNRGAPLAGIAGGPIKSHWKS